MMGDRDDYKSTLSNSGRYFLLFTGEGGESDYSQFLHQSLTSSLPRDDIKRGDVTS